MQWNRSGSGDKNFCARFSSGHVPVNIPCPVLGGPVDLLSRPPPCAELGHRQRQNERWPRELLRTPRVNWLFLDSLCLGEEEKGIEFLKLFVALVSHPLNPAALIQTSVWTPGVRGLTEASKTLLSTDFPLWQFHSPIQTPPQGRSNHVTQKDCQSVFSPLMDKPTYICRHPIRLPQEALWCLCFPSAITRFKGDLQSKQDHSQHGVEEAESPLCCWWWSHTGTTAGNRASLTTCYEILWINGMCFFRWLQYGRSWLTD